MQAAEKIDYRPAPGIPGVGLLMAENVARRWRVLHETYSVCTLLRVRGGAEWTYRGELLRSQPNELMIMEPGEVHANTRITDAATFSAVFISPPLIRAAASELGMRSEHPHLKQATFSHPAVVRQFVRMHRAMDSGTELERETHLAECMKSLLEHCAEDRVPAGEPTSRPGLLRAREFIDDNCMRAIGLREIAAVSGLSAFHFARAFTRRFGLSPHAYQIRRRISAGHAQMMAGKGLSEVAADVGFADQSHFTRHFREIYGVTPGAYLRGLGTRPRDMPAP